MKETLGSGLTLDQHVVNVISNQPEESVSDLSRAILNTPVRIVPRSSFTGLTTHSMSFIKRTVWCVSQIPYFPVLYISRGLWGILFVY